MTQEYLIELPLRLVFGRYKKKVYHTAPSLNAQNTMHYQQKKAVKDYIQKFMEENFKNPPKFKIPVIQFTRYTPLKGLDYDNLSASFKFIGDALVRHGLYEDDNPEILWPENVTIRNGKSRNWIESRVVVRINEYSPK